MRSAERVFVPATRIHPSASLTYPQRSMRSSSIRMPVPVASAIAAAVLGTAILDVFGRSAIW